MFSLKYRKSVWLFCCVLFVFNLNAQTSRVAPEIRLKSTLETGKFESFEFSPDASQINVVSNDQIQIWNTQNGKLIRSEDIQSAGKRPATDGYIWFSVTEKFQVLRLEKNKNETQNRVVIWDREKGAIVSELKGFEQKINRAVFSRDENRILTFSEPKKEKLRANSPITEVIVWDTANGNLKSKIFLTDINDFAEPLFSADGSKFITAQKEKYGSLKTKVWNAENGKLLYDLFVPPRKTADGKDIDVSRPAFPVLEFTSDGKLLIAATADAVFGSTEDGNLIAYNAENGEVVWETPDVSPDSERYLNFTVSRDEKILAVVKEIDLNLLKQEVTAEIREVKTGKLLTTLKTPEPEKRKIVYYNSYSRENNLIFSQSAKTLITAGRSLVEVWNIATGERRCTFPRVWEPTDSFFGNGTHTDEFTFRLNDKIIAAQNDQYLRIWNAENCELITKIETPVWKGAVWSRDERFILSALKDKKSMLLFEVISN